MMKNSLMKTICIVVGMIAAVMFIFTGIIPPAQCDAADSSVFGKAQIDDNLQDYIDDPRAEPLFDDEGNYFGFIPMPFAPEKYVAPAGLLKASSRDSKYDMRDPDNDGNYSDSLLSPVKNQEECGACWSFASLDVFESSLLKNNQVYDFSENHMISHHGYDPGPCEGGNLLFTSAYISSYKGTVAEKDDPYPTNPSCTDCTPLRYIDNIVMLPVRSNIEDYQYVKDMIIEYGALYTSIYYDYTNYDSETATYYYIDFDSSFDDSNHAVVIVGWDDNKMVGSAGKKGAFIVKNSWGSEWGDDGYFYVSYYDESIAFDTLGAVVEKDDAALPFNKVYQHDEVGWSGSAVNANVAWGANWFVPESSGKLNAVSFAATRSQMNYEIIIYDDLLGFSGSFSNVIARQSGSLKYQGWYTIPLDTPISVTAGDGFGIAVKFSSGSSSANYLIPIETRIDNFTSTVEVNPGESYVSVNGTEWLDSTAFDYNVSIKGLVAENEVVVCDQAPENVEFSVTTEGTTVTISWDSSPGCAQTQYDFYYADFPSFENISMMPMGTQHQISKEFAQGSSYYFVVLAKNDKGSIFSDVEFFEVPCSNPFLCRLNKTFPGSTDVFDKQQQIASENWNLVTMTEEEAGTAMEEFYSKNSDNIDDLLELKVQVSRDPANLTPLKKSTWSYEIITDRLYTGDLYFADSVSTVNGDIPALLTVDHNGNKGVTFFGKLPYDSSKYGFITSIKDGSCNAYYFFETSSDHAMGRYQEECNSSLSDYSSFAANEITNRVTLVALKINGTDYIKFDYFFPEINQPVDIFVALYTPSGNFRFLNSDGDFVNDFGKPLKVGLSKTLRDKGFYKKSQFKRGNYVVFWLIAPTAGGSIEAALDSNNYIFDSINFTVSN